MAGQTSTKQLEEGCRNRAAAEYQRIEHAIAPAVGLGSPGGALFALGVEADQGSGEAPKAAVAVADAVVSGDLRNIAKEAWFVPPLYYCRCIISLLKIWLVLPQHQEKRPFWNEFRSRNSDSLVAGTDELALYYDW